jgi:DNA adenine methylase
MEYSLFGYMGGKSRLAPELQSRSHLYIEQFGLERFVDACGGSGKIVMGIEGVHRVYCDVVHGLVNLMQCLKSPNKTAELISVLESLPYSRKTFNKAVANFDREDIPLVESAAYTYIAAKQSIVGNMKTFYESHDLTVNEERQYDYYSKLDELEVFNFLMRDVEIHRRGLLDTISAYRDDSKTLLFLDPPYVMKQSENSDKLKRHYKHSPSVQFHRDMVAQLLDVRCKVILCGYKTPVYDPLLTNGCHEMLLDIIPVPSARFSGTEKYAEEFIWTNFNPNIFQN